MAISNTADRRALRRAYKDNSRPTGVFQIRSLVDGRTLLISSVDLPARINRERFQLRLGGHPHKALQAEWHRLGPESFVFEILDTLAPPADAASFDPNAELVVLEAMWAERIVANSGDPGFRHTATPQHG